MTILSIGLVVMAVPTFGMGLLDERSVSGLPWTANVWAKPLKFQLSMAIQMLTIAWAMTWMKRHAIEIPARRFMVIALTATVLFEAVYITVQGARGVPSHFNRATPWEDMGATMMATGAYVLVGASAWVGLVAAWHWLRHATARRDPILLAIALGFVAMFFLAGFTGAAMGEHRGPFVRAITAPSAVLPLTGWRTDIGDLRIAHFFGVHAMQALPLVAWTVARLPRAPATAAIVAIAGIWVLATVALMQHALADHGVL